MRIVIQHRTHYTYSTPAKSIMQLLRLTPRNHDGQNVRHWRIDLGSDGTLKAGEDPFGNLTHMLALSGPIAELEVTVEGEVETEDRQGVVRGTYERFPIGLYLRETPLTEADAALKEFTRDLIAAKTDRLERLHSLLLAHQQRDHVRYRADHQRDAGDRSLQAETRGVPGPHPHTFIACARHLGIPARYIGGYMLRTDGMNQQEAGHAWAEARDRGSWAGSDSIPPTASARPSITCASRSGSTIWAPPRSAGRARGALRNRCRSPCRSARPARSGRADPLIRSHPSASL